MTTASRSYISVNMLLYELPSCGISYSVAHLFPHFLRGFFDGDGSVFLTKYNSLNVHFVGLLNIIEYIREYLKSIGIRSGLYPCFSTDAVWELRFGNVHNVHKIYELMYKNAKLYLPRKKKKSAKKLLTKVINTTYEWEGKQN